jgi:hypothetical protein
MNYYEITNTIRQELEATNQIKVVTHGSLEDVDLARQTIYPLAHITPSAAATTEKTIQWSFSIVVMDIVDFNKYDLRDQENPFYGTDNKQDVLNTIMYALQKMVSRFRRGTPYSNLVRLVSEPTYEPFVDRYENLLAGWSIQLQLETPNTDVDYGIC